MRVMTPAEKFKTREAQAPIPVAAAMEAVTRVVATPAEGGTLEEATQGVVIQGAAEVDLIEETEIADGTRRMTKGWRN